MAGPVDRSAVPRAHLARGAGAGGLVSSAGRRRRSGHVTGHADVDDHDVGPGLAGQHVDGGAAGEEVGDHLGRDLLRPGRHPLGVDAVVAGEHGHGRGPGHGRRATRRRWRPAGRRASSSRPSEPGGLVRRRWRAIAVAGRALVERAHHQPWRRRRARGARRARRAARGRRAARSSTTTGCPAWANPAAISRAARHDEGAGPGRAGQRGVRVDDPTTSGPSPAAARWAALAARCWSRSPCARRPGARGDSPARASAAIRRRTPARRGGSARARARRARRGRSWRTRRRRPAGGARTGGGRGRGHGHRVQQVGGSVRSRVHHGAPRPAPARVRRARGRPGPHLRQRRRQAVEPGGVGHRDADVVGEPERRAVAHDDRRVGPARPAARRRRGRGPTARRRGAASTRGRARTPTSSAPGGGDRRRPARAGRPAAARSGSDGAGQAVDRPRRAGRGAVGRGGGVGGHG